MGKRALGLGNSQDKKNKKKKNSPETNKPEDNFSKSGTSKKHDEVTIKLSEGKSELEQMWLGYVKYNKIQKEESDNAELSLNGMVHECDRILRKLNNPSNAKITTDDIEKEDVKANAEFYGIYGLALAELAYYQGKDDLDEDAEFDEEKEAKSNELKIKKISEFFGEALDRIDVGFSLDSNTKYDKNLLKLAKLQILINQIPLQYISTMDLNSKKKKYPNFSERLQEIFTELDEIINNFSNNKTLIKSHNDSSYYLDFTDYQQFLILDSLDDLLDMIENFGVNDDIDDVDSDNDEAYESSRIQLSEKHPLFRVRNKITDFEDKLINLWEMFLNHLKFVNKTGLNLDLSKLVNDADQSKNQLLNFYFLVNEKVGHLYLKKADLIGREYTSLIYGEDDDENANEKDIDGKLVKHLQKDTIDLYKKAIVFLKKAENREDPESWVSIAEVEISLGNIYEIDSADQEKCYKKAEKRLKKASIATNGKYDNVLKNLLG